MAKLSILYTFICGLSLVAGRDLHKTAAPSCDVETTTRKDCGWKGITVQECEDFDCCFDNNIWRVIWCYYPFRYDAACRASGDVHYITFDGEAYDFQGSCKYILTTPTAAGLPQFTVMAKNEYRYGISAVTWTEYVEVEIPGHVIRIDQGQAVYVDGDPTTVPATVDTGIEIFRYGFTMRLETDFGLIVDFDGDSMVEIRLSADYKGQVEGLCGNYDGDPNDDPDVSTADHWEVDSDCSSPPDAQRNAEIDPDVLEQAVTMCSPLEDLQGPFQSLIQDPASFHTFYMASCVMDVSHVLPLLGSFGAIHIACKMMASFAGQILGEPRITMNWRDSVAYCQAQCPSGYSYAELAPGCPETCSTPEDCPRPARESCVCNGGTVLQGTTCVPLSAC